MAKPGPEKTESAKAAAIRVFQRQTPLTIAQEKNRREAAALLRRHGA